MRTAIAAFLVTFTFGCAQPAADNTPADAPLAAPTAGDSVEDLLRGRGQRKFRRWHERCQQDGCCDDTELTCDRRAPTCGRGTELAIQDGCWTCVNPRTCAEPCDEGEQYDPEVGACCPEAIYVADCWCEAGWEYSSYEDRDEQGCLLGYGCQCTPPDCDDGFGADCLMAEPQCAPGLIVAEKNGCYECVVPATCEPPACDDGAPVLCDMLPPQCAPGLIAAARNGCFECVEPATCRAPSPCDDGGQVFCDMLPPTCDPGMVAAARNGCYECVWPDTCEATACGPETAWDPSLGACCPTVFFVADCIPCEDGQSPVGESVYDDNGCFLGSTCVCR